MRLFEKEIAISLLMAFFANAALPVLAIAGPTAPYKAHKIKDEADANEAINDLDKIYLKDFFPSAFADDKGVELAPAELANFETAFQDEVAALNQIGFFKKTEFMSCWDQEKGQYLNKPAVRSLPEASIGHIVSYAWISCLKKHPDKKAAEKWYTHFFSLTAIGGFAGGIAIFIARTVMNSVQTALSVRIVGNWVEAFLNPGIGGLTELFGIIGRKAWGIGDAAPRLNAYIGTIAGKLENVSAKLNESKVQLSNAKRLAAGMVDPVHMAGLTSAQLERNLDKFNTLFANAVQIWSETLTPNSQAGRSIVIDGAFFRPKSFINDLVTFQNKMELFRQSQRTLEALLKRAITEKILSVESAARSQIDLIQASGKSADDKQSELKEIQATRDQQLSELRREESNLQQAVDDLLRARGHVEAVEHDVIQDSNILLNQAMDELAARELPANQSIEIINQIKFLRDEEFGKRETSDATLDFVKRQLEALKKKAPLFEDFIKNEIAMRKTAVSQIIESEKAAKELSEKIIELGGEQKVLDEILQKETEILLSKRQMNSVMAVHYIHAQMFREFDYKAKPEMRKAVAVMQKELGLSYYQDALKKDAWKILREMGFEMGEEKMEFIRPTDVIDQLEGKLDKDIRTVDRQIKTNKFAALFDAIKAKLNWGNIGAHVAEDAEKATKVAKKPTKVDCENNFNSIR